MLTSEALAFITTAMLLRARVIVDERNQQPHFLEEDTCTNWTYIYIYIEINVAL